jgi:hypothetical protein
MAGSERCAMIDGLQPSVFRLSVLVAKKQWSPILPAMRRTYLNGVACAVLFFFALSLPSNILGQELTFIPTFNSYHGELELDMMKQTTGTKHGDQVSKVSDTVFQEKFNFNADGFVYHPRFIVFSAYLSEGIDQGRTSGSGGRSDTALDYELRTTVLPEHPYKLDLFTLHHDFVNRPATFIQGQTSTLDEQGASFSYRGRPFSFGASYNTLNGETSTTKVDSTSYRMHANYNLPWMMNLANYAHSESASSAGVHSAYDSYGFGNTIRYTNIVLDSRVNNIDISQVRTFDPELQTHTFTWMENLQAPLPWNFKAMASLDYVDENNLTAAGLSSPEHEENNRSLGTGFNLTQYLYQSLITSYSINNHTSDSISGEFTTKSETLGSAYTKTIPTGLLRADIIFSKSESDLLGTPTILNEVHSAALLGSFLLNQQNVIDSSIVVQVKDPVTSVLTKLPQSDYLINHLGNDVQITIISVFPVTPLVDPAAIYEFHLNYSLSQQSQTDQTAHGYSLKTDFLHNMLSAYYSYFTSKQVAVIGSGGSDISELETIGMTCRIDQYTGLVERKIFRSTINPYDSTRAMAQFLTPLSDVSNIYADISYEHTDFLPSPRPPFTAAHIMNTLGMNVRTDIKFPSKNLNLFVSGSYFLIKALVDSDIRSLNAYLNWRVGLISVDLGVQTSRNETKTATSSDALMSNYYYFTLRRALF